MNNGIKYKWSKDFNKKLRLVKPEKKTVPEMPKENKETNISQELTHKNP